MESESKPTFAKASQVSAEVIITRTQSRYQQHSSPISSASRTTADKHCLAIHWYSSSPFSRNSLPFDDYDLERHIDDFERQGGPIDVNAAPQTSTAPRAQI